MRHHAEDVAALVDDSRDAVFGAVDIGVRAELAVGVRIPEDNTRVVFESLENLWRGDVSPLSMRDRNSQHLTLFVTIREHRVSVLDAYAHLRRNELEVD